MKAVWVSRRVPSGDAAGGGARSVATPTAPLRAIGAEVQSDARAALSGGRDLRGGGGGANESARELRHRLVGSGPWEIAEVGAVMLLSGGVAHELRRGERGTWRIDAGVGGPRGEMARGAPLIVVDLRGTRWMRADCWTLHSAAGGGGLDHGGFARPVHATMTWAKPARRCFATCAELTRPIGRAELGGSTLARHAARHVWSWAGNRQGLTFTFDSRGVGLLTTPWGHGTWGVTTRADVLVAEFAHQRHMLRFEGGDGGVGDAPQRFVSTRCLDGEVVSGEALRVVAD